MKYCICILLLISAGCSQHLKMPDKIIASDYFYLDAKEIPYSFAISNVVAKTLPAKIHKSISFSPRVKSVNNKVGEFIHDHKRFEYLIFNRTSETIKESLKYKNDIDSMKIIFHSGINHDSLFNKYFNTFIKPLYEKELKKDIFSSNDLMMVASRFFYCDTIYSNFELGWHICIGINGQKESEWNKDYTLLEAFCFEGIFKLGKNKMNDLIHVFQKAGEASVNNNLTKVNYDNKKLLALAKNDTYKKMESSNELKDFLMNYYRENESNLPFIIQLLHLRYQSSYSHINNLITIQRIVS